MKFLHYIIWSLFTTLLILCSVLVIVAINHYGNSTTEEMPIKEYLKWINNTDNGLTKSRIVNELELKVKYLPPDYILYQEIDEKGYSSQATLDSLRHQLDQSATFLMSISPVKNSKRWNDITMTGLPNYQAFRERKMTLNFDMSEAILLKTDDFDFVPVLSVMEDVYGLKKGRTFIFVFTPKVIGSKIFNGKVIDFIYDDEIFNTGINHFRFNINQLENTPKLIINT